MINAAITVSLKSSFVNKCPFPVVVFTAVTVFVGVVGTLLYFLMRCGTADDAGPALGQRPDHSIIPQS